MRKPAARGLAFLTIYATCIAGALGLGWWSAIAAACILVLISLHNTWSSAGAGGRAPTLVSDPVQLAASALNALAVCGLGFMIGHAAARLAGFG